MTQAQKTAKAKFKQAIAYRQKTGVSLKEAFAHIYGKKVGAVKKSAKKKYTNLQLKKLANDFAYYTSGNLDKSTYRLLDKDYTDKLIPEYEKAIKEAKKKLNKKPIKKAVPKKKIAKKVVKKKAAKKVAKKKLTRIDYDKRHQAKKPGKRKSASGNTYYENRANRSDKGKLLGIGAFSQETIKKIENQLKDLQALEGKVRTYTIFKNSANYKNPSSQKIINSYIKKAKEQIKETKTHISQLKKHI